jgi:hypothetical protein
MKTLKWIGVALAIAVGLVALFVVGVLCALLLIQAVNGGAS